MKVVRLREYPVEWACLRSEAANRTRVIKPASEIGLGTALESQIVWPWRHGEHAGETHALQAPSGGTHQKESPMEVVYPRCCGIDVHKATVVACISNKADGPNGKAEAAVRHDHGGVARTGGLAARVASDRGGHGSHRRVLEAGVELAGRIRTDAGESAASEIDSRYSLLAEIGADMTQFPTAGAQASWAAICPRCYCIVEVFGSIEVYPEDMETPAADIKKRSPVEPTTIEEWAALQGVVPVTDFKSFLGHPSPEDETEEEFAAMLREWRSEGSKQNSTR